VRQAAADQRDAVPDQRLVERRAGRAEARPVADEVIGRVAIPGPVRRGDGRHGLVADADGATLDEPFPR